MGEASCLPLPALPKSQAPQPSRFESHYGRDIHVGEHSRLRVTDGAGGHSRRHHGWDPCQGLPHVQDRVYRQNTDPY